MALLSACSECLAATGTSLLIDDRPGCRTNQAARGRQRL